MQCPSVVRVLFLFPSASTSSASAQLLLRQALRGPPTFRLLHASAPAAGSKQTKLKKAYDLDKTKQWIKKLSPEDKAYLLEALQPPETKQKQPPKEPTPQPESAAPREEAEAAGDIPRPTNHELSQLAFHASLPFIGFGFLDNFIMIVAGDYIDHHIGVTLGIRHEGHRETCSDLKFEKRDSHV